MEDKAKQAEIAILIRGEDPNVVQQALAITQSMKEENGGPIRTAAWSIQDVAGVMDLAREMVKLEQSLPSR